MYQAGLLLSLTYCFTAGALALWSPAHNGIDIAVCYVAGVTARQGVSPYDFAELTSARRALNSPLAGMPSFPFAYPPSAIPACVLLSFLPWERAQALWKLLNVAFLIGSVMLAFRLFSDLRFALDDKYLVWSFAFILSATVSVLLVGQSTLFVLFTALLAMVSCHLGKSLSAGFSLALALTKPHLALPFVCLMIFRRQYKIIVAASAAFGVLVLAGLYVGHSDIGMYPQVLRKYLAWNDPASPHLVGIQNLAVGVFGLSPTAGSLLSVTCGVLFLGVTYYLDNKDGCRDNTEDTLPLVLLTSVLAFGAHSYDLVFLIPVYVWARGRRNLPIVILCCILIVPLGVVAIAYERLLASFIPLPVFHAVIEPFRSWTLLIMFVLATNVTYRRAGQERGAVG